jgi:pimeloyl-ACP methyl ester carboxylesterase
MTIDRAMIKVGEYEWFYRECQPLNQLNQRPAVVFLHGLIAPSYSWRQVMPELMALGFRCIAPDWLGTGNSQIPDRLDFPYTPAALSAELGKFLDAMGIEQCALVVQGYSGVIGVKYALEHPDRIDRLAILNAPISAQAKLPWQIRQLGIPLVGDALVQDFRLPDKIIEGGGGYRVEEKAMNIYRNPWLESSDGGRILHTLIRNLNVPELGATIEQGLKTWDKPLLLAWGDRDPWLPIAAAKATAQGFPAAEFVTLEEVGHYPQEDWHEKVVDAVGTFLRRSVI